MVTGREANPLSTGETWSDLQIYPFMRYFNPLSLYRKREAFVPDKAWATMSIFNPLSLYRRSLWVIYRVRSTSWLVRDTEAQTAF